MEMVRVQFQKRAIVKGGALYLPGEVASFLPDVAQSFIDCNAATLITSLDGPPKNKMVGSPVNKKERHG